MGQVHGGRQRAVHVVRLVALDGDDVVAVAAQQALELLARDPRGHRGVRDLVAVEVQDRQHRPVVDGVDELVGVPRRGQRAGLELPVPHDRGDDEVRVVHRGAVRVGEDVAELAALVDRARRLGRHVAGDAAGERELPEQRPHPVAVVADAGVGLAVGALQPGVRHRRRAAVARTGQEDRVDVAFADQPVEVGVEQVQPGRRAPVAEQPRLDVVRHQGSLQQRVVQQVDLADGEVVGGAEPPVEQVDLGVTDGRALAGLAGLANGPPEAGHGGSPPCAGPATFPRPPGFGQWPKVHSPGPRNH